MDTLFQDVRYALRQCARRSGFSAVAILSLGLAIGGNSLTYGWLDGFVFHPLGQGSGSGFWFRFEVAVAQDCALATILVNSPKP